MIKGQCPFGQPIAEAQCSFTYLGEETAGEFRPIHRCPDCGLVVLGDILGDTPLAQLLYPLSE